MATVQGSRLYGTTADLTGGYRQIILPVSIHGPRERKHVAAVLLDVTENPPLRKTERIARERSTMYRPTTFAHLSVKNWS